MKQKNVVDKVGCFLNEEQVPGFKFYLYDVVLFFSKTFQPAFVTLIFHRDLGKTKEERTKKLSALIRKGEICYGGYCKAKIYGLLRCGSGRRMKMENRVFFKDESTAIKEGYRPCGNCLPEKYRQWKTAEH